MVFIPSGEATLGTARGRGERVEHQEAVDDCECDVQALVWEEPLQRVAMTAFCMDRTEVTVADYGRCVDAKGCQPICENPGAGCAEYNSSVAARESYPVNGVSFPAAGAYCAWVGKALPTGKQWEYAARGPDGQRFPWGEELPSPRVMSARAAAGEALADTPVGSHLEGASAFGVLDLLGQLSEWALPDRGYSVPIGYRRGYVWPMDRDDGDQSRWTTTRASWDSQSASPTDGFRCVVEPLR